MKLANLSKLTLLFLVVVFSPGPLEMFPMIALREKWEEYRVDTFLVKWCYGVMHEGSWKKEWNTWSNFNVLISLIIATNSKHLIINVSIPTSTTWLLSKTFCTILLREHGFRSSEHAGSGSRQSCQKRYLEDPCPCWLFLLLPHTRLHLIHKLRSSVFDSEFQCSPQDVVRRGQIRGSSGPGYITSERDQAIAKSLV